MAVAASVRAGAARVRAAAARRGAAAAALSGAAVAHGGAGAARGRPTTFSCEPAIARGGATAAHTAFCRFLSVSFLLGLLQLPFFFFTISAVTSTVK